jgi:uncharacterized membrane protein SirB2
MIGSNDSNQKMPIKARIKNGLRDCLRVISMVSGVIIGFALAIALPYDEYLSIYFFALILLITIGIFIIKYKLYNRKNPVVDFFSALIVGYVPPTPFVVLALLLAD